MPSTTDPEAAPFAATLRAVRARLGVNQADVARKAGLTPSYLSMLESRRKPPPSDAVVRRLARALDLEPAFLLEIAHLERTPEDIRRQMEGLRHSLEMEKEVSRSVLRGPLLSTLWHFLARRGFADSSLETLRLSRKTKRLVRSLAREAGSAESPEAFRERTSSDLEGLDAEAREELIEALPALARSGSGSESDVGAPVLERLPTATASPPPETGRLPVPAGLSRPDSFWFRAPDQDMYPRIQAGDLVLLHPGAEAENGDVVAVRLADRDTLRTWMAMAGGIELTAANSSLPPLAPGDGIEVVAVARWMQRPLGSGA